jgi:hypothetical protein
MKITIYVDPDLYTLTFLANQTTGETLTYSTRALSPSEAVAIIGRIHPHTGKMLLVGMEILRS